MVKAAGRTRLLFVRERWPRWPWVVAALVVVGEVILLAVPMPVERVLTKGTDRYAAHYVLFGERRHHQAMRLEGPLQGIGAVVVPMVRGRPSDVEVAVASDSGQLLADGTIVAASVADDAFAWVHFPTPVGQGGVPVVVTFSAPSATSAQPMGLRFDEDRDGLAAVALNERVSLTRYLSSALWPQADVVRWRQAVGLGGLFALVSWLGTSPLVPGALRRYGRWVALTVLVGVVVGVRLNILAQLNGVSGGDPYNYLAITQHLAAGENPFTADKRLPGWPVLLVPAYVTALDDIWFMRFLSVISAGGVVALTAVVARTLGLPWTAQLGAAALIAFQKDFLWTSLRPEPYTFYALLLLAALVLFLAARRSPLKQILLGLVLGYAAMTRQEGFVLAAVIGVASLTRWRQWWWRGYARVAGLGLLLTLPYFINNALASGNPFYTPYFAGKRLEIVDSWQAFRDAAGATWGVLGSLWRPLWDELMRVPVDHPLFGSVVAFTLAWWFVRAWRAKAAARWQAGLVVASGVAVLLLLVAASVAVPRSEFRAWLTIALAAVPVAGIAPLLAVGRSRAVLVLAVLVSQVLIATWFHPYPKHYQQDYPLLMVLAAAALLAGGAIRLPWHDAPARQAALPLGAVSLGVFRTAVATPFVLVTMLLFTKLPTAIDESNHATALDHVVYQAVTLSHTLPKPVAFDSDYQIARLYVDADATRRFPGEDAATWEEWVETTDAQTVVFTRAGAPAAALPAPWRLVKSFASEGKREVVMRSYVYTLHR